MKTGLRTVHSMLRILTVALFGAHFITNTQSVSETDYPFETHRVTTTDGYILELQRIPRGSTAAGFESKDKKVVFLMHGFITFYNSFTYLGPEYGIAYNLADAGFDVWMGNARGTKPSRHHVNLDPDKDKFKFFDITYEDIGLNDLPAIFDYVLGTTKQEKLHYIAHSQGGAVFLVLNSISNAYQSKIASAHLLAGVGYQQYTPSVAVKLLAANIDALYATLFLAGYVEFRLPVVDPAVIDIVNYIIDILFNSPLKLFGGASTRQAAHFFQNIRDKAFRSWNYGSGNLAKYGSLLPPAYNLTNINIDVTLHYSLADIFVSEKDTLNMAKAMPKAKARKVSYDLFAHWDYVVNPNVKKLVTDYIIQSFEDF